MIIVLPGEVMSYLEFISDTYFHLRQRANVLEEEFEQIVGFTLIFCLPLCMQMVLTQQLSILPQTSVMQQQITYFS